MSANFEMLSTKRPYQKPRMGPLALWKPPQEPLPTVKQPVEMTPEERARQDATVAALRAALGE